MTRPTWDETFTDMCTVLARRSKDESTKLGCMIVDCEHSILSSGYNCFPRGINDNDKSRQARPHKYNFIEHAERNAIYNAGRIGVPLIGSTLHTQMFPCANCARGIIQSGIRTVVIPNGIPKRWEEQAALAWEMFCESGVVCRFINNHDKILTFDDLRIDEER